MANPIPFNKRGIYGIRTVGTPTVTTTDATLHFEAHPYVAMPYNGILIVNITTAVNSTGSGTLPVYFQTGNGAKVAATKANGAALTGADVNTTGYYLFFFDRDTNVLQLFN